MIVLDTNVISEAMKPAAHPAMRARLNKQVTETLYLTAARHYTALAVTARNVGRGFPTPAGYIVAIAASRGFIVASRDTSPYEAGGLRVIDPWQS